MKGCEFRLKIRVLPSLLASVHYKGSNTMICTDVHHSMVITLFLNFLAHTGGARLAPTSAHPRDLSPCGALGLAGNIFEWCDDAAPTGGGSGALLIVPVLLIAALACCGVGLAARRIFTLHAHALAPGGVRRAQTGPMSAVELQRAVAAAEGPMVPLSLADSAAVQAVVVPAGREYHPEVVRVV